MPKKQILLLIVVCVAVLGLGAVLLNQQAVKQGKLEEQRATREEIVSKDPEKYARMEQALRDAKEKVKKEPGNYEAWVDIGVISAAFADYRTAEDAYRRAIATNQKGGFVAWNNLAELYKSKSRWTEAVETYRSAIQAIPQEVEFYYNLAEIQADGKGGTKQDALETLERGMLATGATQLQAAKERLQKDGRL